ncbi:Lipase 1 [Papilio xuthus]|uniref:Lipase n=2 Tax=Papilio xuthus TaxID=66420 RepID=A0A194Q4F5_PAPXU|nr:Lipase 1 [Papilio xuthus]
MSARSWCIILLCLNNLFESESQFRLPESYKSVPNIIRGAGYPAEEHRALTPDGYILQLHRIPTGRGLSRSSGVNKKAVLILHGVFGCSSNFILMGPGKSLGFMLADAGYDVWLGNLRGNRHTAHLNLTRDNPKFWEYSFHEHGKYDVPVLIDKVLAVTGQSSLLYIGHSMGTTSFFITASLRPEYNHKVVAFVGLAPAVYFDHMKWLADFLLKSLKIVNWLRERGFMTLGLPPVLMELFIRSVCSTKNPRDNFCVFMTQNLVGENFDQVDPNVTTQMMTRVQPASWRQFEHYGKIALTSVFTSLDDGVLGDAKPYNLSNIRVPIVLLYGENDQIAEKSQVMRLARELNNTGMLEQIEPACSLPKFNHVDFLFSKDIAPLLNKPLVQKVKQLFEKYSYR